MKPNKTRYRILIPALIVLVIAVCAVIGVRVSHTSRSSDLPAKSTAFSALVMDANAEEGGLVNRSKEEIQAELNAKVAQGMINISMNTAPVFPSGTEKGNLLIVNSERNNYPQIVYIVRKDTGEEIYRSGGIPVGSKIEYAALDVNLPAGVYDCVAYFNNVDETGAILGTAGAEVSITIES